MQSDPETEPVLVSAFAAELKVSPSTLYRAIHAGQLEALRIGQGRGTLRLTSEACAAYRAACRENATAH